MKKFFKRVIKRKEACKDSKNKIKDEIKDDDDNNKKSRKTFWKRMLKSKNKRKLRKENILLQNSPTILLIPIDILHEIFYYLQNDLHSLHSCLRVSKQWCQAIIPIFWSKPFRENKSSVNVVNTFLKCLNKQEKNNLTYNLGNLDDGDGDGNNLDIDILDDRSTVLFQYANFLREITLCRLFLTNSKSLRSLSLDFYNSSKFKSYPYFPYHKMAKQFLTNLCELTIHYHLSRRDLFMDFQEYCKNLKRLELIDYTWKNLPEKRHDSVRKLIQNQNGLQYLKIYGYGECCIVKPMIGLSYQSKSLVHFELIYYNLVSLKLVGPYGHEREFKEFLPQLSSLLPLTLRNLSLDLSWVIFDNLDEFLKNCKPPLNSFYIGGWKRQMPINHLLIIKKYLKEKRKGIEFYEFVKDIT
ncbi:6273_t:CDS:2, partial [Diversispora eburnea]